ALELAHHARDHALDPLRLDLALPQRRVHRALELVAVERHPPPGFLDHHQFAQLYALERGEAAAAAGTDAAAAKGVGILGRPAVLPLRVVVSAIGTAHPGLP